MIPINLTVGISHREPDPMNTFSSSLWFWQVVRAFPLLLPGPCSSAVFQSTDLLSLPHCCVLSQSPTTGLPQCSPDPQWSQVILLFIWCSKGNFYLSIPSKMKSSSVIKVSSSTSIPTGVGSNYPAPTHLLPHTPRSQDHANLSSNQLLLSPTSGCASLGFINDNTVYWAPGWVRLTLSYCFFFTWLIHTYISEDSD